MTYQAIVRNGVVALPDDVRLPEGTRVRVETLDESGTSAGLPGFGIWRDRTDMTDSARAARDLRRTAERRAGDRN